MLRIALIWLCLAASWPTVTAAQDVDEGDAETDAASEAEVAVEGDAEDEAGAEDDSDDTLPASTASEAPVAKIAVVTIGDPDDGLRQRARELDRMLVRDDGLALPADSGLRGALRGDPGPDEDDGLGRVRAQRRTLGLDDADDAGGLRALGRVSGAVAVVAIRRGAGSIRAFVLDVASARLYEGELDLDAADDASIVRFVLARARASSLLAAEREAEAQSDGSWRDAAAETARRRSDTERDEPEAEDGEGDEDEPGFFAKYWPYLVAGVLLAGALIYAFTIDTTPDTPPPVLRFIPGGN